jgi:hypothetical protein
MDPGRSTGWRNILFFGEIPQRDDLRRIRRQAQRARISLARIRRALRPGHRGERCLCAGTGPARDRGRRRGVATAAGCGSERELPAVASVRRSRQGAGGFVPTSTTTCSRRRCGPRSRAGPSIPCSRARHDEWRLFVALNPEFVTGRSRPRSIRRDRSTPHPAGGCNRHRHLRLSSRRVSSPSIALGAVGTDAIFACNARTAAGCSRTSCRPSPTSSTIERAAGFLPRSAPYGASHASELSTSSG